MFSPQLPVEPGTRRFKSFHCEREHSAGPYIPTIVTIRRTFKQMNTYSRAHHLTAQPVRKSPAYRWMSPSLRTWAQCGWISLTRASVISVQLQGIGKRSTAFISLAVFNRLGAGFILQYCGATEFWLHINRQSLHRRRLPVWLSWASGTSRKLHANPLTGLWWHEYVYFCS